MSLGKLLRPRSLAVAGGDWADAVIAGNRKLGFAGPIHHVHPRRQSSAARSYVPSVDALPEVPDCAAIGVANMATIDMVATLAAQGAGGAVCFASGFSELQTPEGNARTAALHNAAGDMPFLGPNCYGFINYVDRVAVWPDQIGGTPVDRGVALICQSGAVAFTLMSNQRSLPIAYLVSVGNQLRVGIHDLIAELAADDRVSAIGMYIEGVPDLPGFIDAVGFARANRVPIALVKSGRSEAASKVALSHTASLSGADQLYQSLFEDLGIARCDSLAELVETLKLLHTAGPIGGDARVLVTGCSGGDMAMTADLSEGLRLDYAALPEQTRDDLRVVLGDHVSLSNPLDFQTFIWPHADQMTAMFTALGKARYDAMGFVIDHPDPAHCDISGYERALRTFVDAVSATGATAAAITSLPETLPERLRAECLRNGIAPLQGLPEALRAFAHAGRIGDSWRQPRTPRLVGCGAHEGEARALTESAAKAMVANAGIAVPRSFTVPAGGVVDAARQLGFPVVLKISSDRILHKTEVGGVAVNLRSEEELGLALERMRPLSDMFLVEEMVKDAVAEILVGAVVDPQFGVVMMVGAGGTLTELMRDSAQLLFPISEEDVARALRRLRIWPLLDGFRGGRKADVEALCKMVVAAGNFVEQHADRLAAFEMNPVFVRAQGGGGVAADVVLCLSEHGGDDVASRPD